MTFWAAGAYIVKEGVDAYTEGEANKSLHNSIGNTWKRYSQETDRQGDQQLERLWNSYDKIADEGYQAYDKSYDALNKGYNDAKSEFEPYAGTEAHELREALSGAMGPEAQEEAYANYRESPGVAWLRERGMSGVNRDAAATGSSSSGNRLKALSEFNQGLALQDFGSYWSRLGEMSGTSFDAARNIAALNEGQGLHNSSLEERRGAFGTQLGAERYGQDAAIRGRKDQAYLDAVMGTGESQANKTVADGNMWRGVAGNLISAGSNAVLGGGNMGQMVQRFGRSALENYGGSLDK